MAVLVGVELDRALGLVLHAYLAPGKARTALFSGGSPPLGTFSTKIDLCRALHLDIIRKIRNEFAHKPEVSFASPEIRSEPRPYLRRRRATTRPGSKSRPPN
jgi:hypothetical protein